MMSSAFVFQSRTLKLKTEPKLLREKSLFSYKNLSFLKLSILGSDLNNK